MAMGVFQSTVSRVRDLTHDVREVELTLCKPEEIVFKAGQFISFDVPKEGHPYPVTRPYSIASPPSISNRVQLLFNLVSGGPGSRYLYGLREGDPVTFNGPAGSFYLREDPTKHIVLVATGTGIAPFRSMILTQRERNHTQSVTLMWGQLRDRPLAARAFEQLLPGDVAENGGVVREGFKDAFGLLGLAHAERTVEMATTIAKLSRISSGYSGKTVGLDGFKDPESAAKGFAECVDVLLLR